MKKLLVLTFAALCVFFMEVHAEYKLLEDDDLCQYTTAISLCYGKNDQSGFIAAKAAIERYEDNPEIILSLKSACCLCIVDKKDYAEMNRFADDVIKLSKRPLSIGIAWMKKAVMASHQEKDENALDFSNISLSILENIQPVTEQGKTSLAMLCVLTNHYVKQRVYEDLEMELEMEKENEIIEKIISSWKY